MNTIRIAVIAIWEAVGVSGYLSLRGAETGESRPAQDSHAQSTRATSAQTTEFVVAERGLGNGAEQSTGVRSPDRQIEPASGPDATELTQPSRPPNHVFDALNADIGPEGEYVDPQALAAMLSYDPELGRQLTE